MSFRVRVTVALGVVTVSAMIASACGGGGNGDGKDGGVDASSDGFNFGDGGCAQGSACGDGGVCVGGGQCCSTTNAHTPRTTIDSAFDNEGLSPVRLATADFPLESVPETC